MKLFKNGVGRPSNEIKEKRRIFIASVIAVIAIVLSLGAMLLFGNGDTENLKGNVLKENKDVTFIASWNNKSVLHSDTNADINWWGIKDGDKADIQVKHSGQKVEKVEVYLYNSSSFSKDSYINYSKETLGSDEIEYIKIPKSKKSMIKDVMYAKVIAYNKKYGSSKNVLWTGYYKLDKTNIYSEELIKESYTSLATKNLKSGLNLKCTSIVEEGKTFSCSYGINKTDKKEKFYLPADWDTNYSFYYDVNGLPDDYRFVFSKNKNGKLSVSLQKPGYKTVEKNLKYIKPKKLVIKCPKSINLGEELFCITNVNYYDYNVKGVQSGYSVGYHNKGNYKLKEIDGFVGTGIGNLLSRYEGGAGKITVTISKSGYKSVTQTVNIVKPKTTKDGLTLSCPKSVKVNEKFICKTNMTGVKLSVTKDNLASGYASSFTTTSSDLTKSAKYTKKGTITVKATKSGYKSKSIKITVK